MPVSLSNLLLANAISLQARSPPWKVHATCLLSICDSILPQYIQDIPLSLYVYVYDLLGTLAMRFSIVVVVDSDSY